MAVNRGKQFEAIVKKGIEAVEGVSIDRLIDPVGGYFGVRNICDFIVYKYPYQIYLECKAISATTLNFKSHISTNQWDGLLSKSKIPGVTAGILVWFVTKDKTLFIPIQSLEELRRKGKKSFSIVSPPNVYYQKIKGKKKRVFFEYDFNEFLSEITPYIKGGKS